MGYGLLSVVAELMAGLCAGLMGEVVASGDPTKGSIRWGGANPLICDGRVSPALSFCDGSGRALTALFRRVHVRGRLMQTKNPHAGLPAFFLFLRAACVALTLIGVSLSAQTAGSLGGRVTDASTGLALAGARVTLAGTELETYTGPAGDYSFASVPLASYSVEVNYVGYPSVARNVEVNGATRLNVAFNAETLELDKLVIEGAAVGSARAINQQRAAATLTSIVAADEIGRFPDQNAAESLQRLPGVSLYRDQGEGRYVDLRGLNYIYTAVSLDGARIASPELGDRAIALDVLPAEAMSAIEVTKVPTPDMEADGLGGSVNLRSKSAFDETDGGLRFLAQGIYTRLTDKFDPKLAGGFSGIFNGGKLGVTGSFSWQERNFGSQNFEEDGWSERQVGAAGPTYFIPDAIGFRDYVINRRRLGVGGGLEFRPDDEGNYYVRWSYNRFVDAEDRHQLYVPFSRGTLTAADGQAATLEDLSRVRRDIRIREKDQTLKALTTGFEWRLGGWQVDGRVAWSEGFELRPNETTARFRRNAGDADLRYSFSGPYSLQVQQLAGAAITDPASYTNLDRLEVQNNSGKETETNAALNLRRDLEGGMQGYVKFGVGYRAKEKRSDVNITRYTAPASFTFATLAGEVNPDYPYGFAVPRLSKNKVLIAFRDNPTGFTPSVLQPDSVLEDWKSDEKIFSAYGMGGITRGDFNVIAGLRYERTDFATKGNDVRGTAITVARAARTYDNLLPGLHLRYDINKQLVARASYSQSITRPAFGETAIFRNTLDNDQEIEAGNPNLETLEAKNWDASLEYYLPSLGVVSAAAFFKQIDNFSYAVTLPNGDPAFPGYDLITFRNGSDGEIKGLELAYTQQLRFLPAPFDGLGFMANATLADSEANYPTRPGEKLRFIGQSDLTGNVALTYEKAGFFVRLALNWRDAHLREDEPIGADTNGDRYIDDYHQLDLTTSYKLSKHMEIFAEATNLTNEPFRVYFNSDNGQGPRLVQFEAYDWTANFGIRLRL